MPFLYIAKKVWLRDRGWAVKMSNSEPNFSLSSAIFSKLQVENTPVAPEKTQQDGIPSFIIAFLILCRRR